MTSRSRGSKSREPRIAIQIERRADRRARRVQHRASATDVQSVDERTGYRYTKTTGWSTTELFM